jgi:hypothetical protein
MVKERRIYINGILNLHGRNTISIAMVEIQRQCFVFCVVENGRKAASCFS